MLVTDMDNFGIIGIDIDSHAMTAFGDYRLREILKTAAGERADATG